MMGKVLLIVCLFVPLVAVVDCGLNEYIIVGAPISGVAPLRRAIIQ